MFSLSSPLVMPCLLLVVLVLISNHATPVEASASLSSSASLASSTMFKSRLHSLGSLESSATSQVSPPLANVATSSVLKNLGRGAALRVLCDLTGGTPLENLKTRCSIAPAHLPPPALMTCFNAAIAGPPIRKLGPITGDLAETLQKYKRLWAGTPSRLVEGSLTGAAFMVANKFVRTSLIARGCPTPLAALAGGGIGGLSQAFIVTPTSLILTHSINNKSTAMEAIKDTYDKGGVMGFYAGFGAIAARQASNWASRTTLTEVAKTTLNLGRFGLAGDVMSGIMGGLGSTWNTPIEVIRCKKQRDAGKGLTTKPYMDYVNEALDEGGKRALFRGIKPRCMQAVWQTNWMVVVPKVLGF